MTPAGDSPLVSVVMIFRDAREFFAEAVDSILAQTYTHWELVLVDDASRDGTAELAARYAHEHPDRVRILQHAGGAHRGTGASRDLGIAAARGALTTFLDADDVWLPDHLADAVALLHRHPEADMVCGRAIEWYAWDGSAREDSSTPLAFAPGTLVPPPAMLTATLRHGAFTVPVCSLLVRTDVLRKTGGSDPKFPALFEDQVMLAKLQLRVTAVMSGALTARYRKHAGSTTASALQSGDYDFRRPNPSRGAFLHWLHTYLDEQSEHADPDLRAALDDARAAYDLPAPRRALVHLRRSVRDALPERVLGGVREARRHARRQVRRVTRPARPGLVRLGSLRRRDPLSRAFGYDRAGGIPIDRVYIERFLTENQHDVRGRVLEIGDASYTRRFGGDRVSRADVLNIRPGHPDTTFIGDLSDAPQIPSDAFDCVILTQTLHLLYDMRAAVRTLARIVRPGGVVLATVPGITPISADEWAATWYWSLTRLSAQRLFAEEFDPTLVDVRVAGNVLAAVAFLEGMSADELDPADLDADDPQFPVTVSVRAMKAVRDER